MRGRELRTRGYERKPTDVSHPEAPSNFRSRLCSPEDISSDPVPSDAPLARRAAFCAADARMTRMRVDYFAGGISKLLRWASGPMETPR